MKNKLSDYTESREEGLRLDLLYLKKKPTNPHVTIILNTLKTFFQNESGKNMKNINE